MQTAFAKNRFKSIVIALTTCSMLVAPISTAYAQNQETVGGIIGGVLGGVLGNAAGGEKNKTLTTIIGVGLGAFIGSRIGKALSKRDRQRMADATHQTITTGQSQNWTGEKASGTTALVGTERRSAQMAVPVLKDRVTQVPPLDFINANYMAVRKDNVLGGPGLDYRPVGALKKSEVVTVTGKVQGQPWYLISQNGVGTGFVAEKALKATTAPVVQTAAVTGEVENRTTQVQRTCRTVKQTVMVNGKEQSENVTACQTANGWEVV